MSENITKTPWETSPQDPSQVVHSSYPWRAQRERLSNNRNRLLSIRRSSSTPEFMKRNPWIEPGSNLDKAKKLATPALKGLAAKAAFCMTGWTCHNWSYLYPLPSELRNKPKIAQSEYCQQRFKDKNLTYSGALLGQISAKTTREAQGDDQFEKDAEGNIIPNRDINGNILQDRHDLTEVNCWMTVRMDKVRRPKHHPQKSVLIQ